MNDLQKANKDKNSKIAGTEAKDLPDPVAEVELDSRWWKHFKKFLARKISGS